MSLAILCPGQGSQEATTLCLLAREPAARDVAEAFEASTGVAVRNLAALAPDDLRRNALAQPLVCATALAAHAVLRDRLPEPVVFAGYSVGELAAYGCAGWLSPERTIALSVERAAAMDEASREPPAMAAVRGLGRAELDAVLANRRVFVAIRNGPDRFVLAGTTADMPAVLAECAARGAGVTPLGVAVASHTPLLRPAVARFRVALEAGEVRVGAPVLAGIDGTPVLTRARMIETLSEQIAAPILWSACMTGLGEAGARAALELPPGADLARLLRDADGAIAARSFAEFRTGDGVAEWVARRIG